MEWLQKDISPNQRLNNNIPKEPEFNGKFNGSICFFHKNFEFLAGAVF